MTPPPPGPPSSGNVYGHGDGRPDFQRDLLGYLSLIFGIIGTGCCCCPWLNGAPIIGGVPAVVLGILHLQKVNRGTATNAWLGWVGIVLGALALVLGICGFAFDWNGRLMDEYDRRFTNM